jgi:hypothetical protein
MTRYQVMTWRDIPAQVKASDSSGEARVQLPSFFQQEIDRAAMAEGLIESDAYLDAWAWSEPAERTGSADEVAVAEEVAQAWLRTNGRDSQGVEAS